LLYQFKTSESPVLEKEIIRQYGPKNGKKIKNRVAVLRNAPTLANVPTVPPFRCHLLTGDYKGALRSILSIRFG
jgi:hypothetical protein